MDAWPSTAEELVCSQEEVGRAAPSPWRPVGEDVAAAACFVCFERGRSGPGRKGETAWAGAAVSRGRRLVAHAVVTGVAGNAYEPGLLALREGPVLETAVRALTERPDALLVDATGRDHPRRAGLALQLGAILDLPSVGVTHRRLLATATGLPTREARVARCGSTTSSSATGCARGPARARSRCTPRGGPTRRRQSRSCSERSPRRGRQSRSERRAPLPASHVCALIGD